MTESEETKYDEVVFKAAGAAHEANRVYCRAIGDDSQPPWEKASQWQKDSACAGVEMIRTKPETTPEQSHEGWLKLKRAEGWVYGSVKNPETKEHPCMVAYSELPPSQRAKDSIFGAVVRGVLAHYGKSS